jgi:hypothetical protein
MISCEAERTLVKSPPELWALLSDPESLAEHLGELGEVRIVRVEPESTVEWEGQGVSGTVQLRASGWGTKVTITAARRPPEPPPEPEPEPMVEPEPELEAQPEPEPAPARRPGFFARLFRSRRLQPTPAPAAAKPQSQPEPTPEPEAPEQEQLDLAAELRALEETMAAQTTAMLTAVLDKLGAAHHRPFSRA